MCNWVNKLGVVTIVLFVFCVVFFSCEEISFGKDQDTAEMLCNRVWVDFYDEDDYTECRRELSFYLDGGGIIRYDYYNIYTGDLLDTFSEYFYWDWNIYGHSIDIEFSDGYSYFDDIIVSGNYLSGILDGYKVTFTDGYLLD